MIRCHVTPRHVLLPLVARPAAVRMEELVGGVLAGIEDEEEEEEEEEEGGAVAAAREGLDAAMVAQAAVTAATATGFNDEVLKPCC